MRHTFKFVTHKNDPVYPHIVWRVYECERCGLLKRVTNRSASTACNLWEATQYHRRQTVSKDGQPIWFITLKEAGELNCQERQ